MGMIVIVCMGVFLVTRVPAIVPFMVMQAQVGMRLFISVAGLFVAMGGNMAFVCSVVVA